MSYGQSTQSSNHGPRQGNTAAHPAQYQSSSNAPQPYPYNYPRRAEAARLQNAAPVSQGQADGRHANANGGNGIPTTTRNGHDAPQSREVINPNMQIPAAVNDSGGSIGELASQMTCFFWFERIETIRKAEKWTPLASPIRRLGPDSMPTSSFRKWVILILSTTQVTPNVILLALLFIYRLKTSNPSVKGKPGSEYRLLTVALMLGNKFLDDNTYTNKTWAEVSGISVGEIHVMEVEFLSNMRYSLFASREEWDEWQTQLGEFSKYFKLASKAPLTPSPIHGGFLPPHSAAAVPVYSPNMVKVKTEQNYQPYPGAYGNTLQALPHHSADLAKKRSYEDILGMEPAPKRPSTMANRQVSSTLQSNLTLRNIPRLPVPNLAVSTNSNMNYAGFSQSLPPPLMSGRAMAQVYPSTPNWTPPQPSMQQQQPAMSLPPIGASTLGYNGAVTPGMTSGYGSGAIYSLPSSLQGTPSRRQSPRSMAVHSSVHSMNSSPITASFANQDLNNNSPSIFLQQRNSPYKPVRPPNKLLYPPPGSYQDYSEHHQPTVDQMHYQPLGRRNDYRTGVVPEYRDGPEPAVYWQQPFRPMASPHYAVR